MLSSHYTRGAGSVYWKVKVVRIRQPDCKSGLYGSGSSPLLSTKWWISVWKNVDNSDYNKWSYNPLPVHSKTKEAVKSETKRVSHHHFNWGLS